METVKVATSQIFCVTWFFLGFLGFSGVSPGFLWGSLAPQKEYSSLSLKNATFVSNSENGMSQKIPITPYPRRLKEGVADRHPLL